MLHAPVVTRAPGGAAARGYGGAGVAAARRAGGGFPRPTMDIELSPPLDIFRTPLPQPLLSSPSSVLRKSVMGTLSSFRSFATGGNLVQSRNSQS